MSTFDKVKEVVIDPSFYMADLNRDNNYLNN